MKRIKTTALTLLSIGALAAAAAPPRAPQRRSLAALGRKPPRKA